MVTFIIVVHIVVSLMLIGVVLIQSGKGAGLADAFGMGGGMGQSLFGAQTGNFLTRLTTVLAILFMVTSILLTIFMGRAERPLIDEIGEEERGGWEETVPAGES
ncbi:preprotein translocase subunit SecG [candidate division NPL-UPA2 bacterium]|nr:preprotein translocase subunit SecG [candidate division NPL-UPA2 bacterium]